MQKENVVILTIVPITDTAFNFDERGQRAVNALYFIYTLCKYI